LPDPIITIFISPVNFFIKYKTQNIFFYLLFYQVELRKIKAGSFHTIFANMKLSQKLGIAYIRTKFRVLAFTNKRRAAAQAFKLFCTPLAKAKRKAEPKSAEAVKFKLNNVTIKGHRWNHPQPNKALILHGFSSAANKFDSYIEPLIKKGYEVIAFDAPAHGDSGGKTINVLEYSEMITTIIKEYGPIKNFIAHSFGGIALSLALENYKHNETTKVVFIAPATETTSAIDAAFKMLRIKDKEVRKEFDQLIFSISGKKTTWFSIRRAVKHITAQVLWIHDEDDDVTPLADAVKVKEDKPGNVQFMFTKGLGHRRIYHDVTVKNKIFSFL
jgi:pimeloyl-ACP methyl ester carboxylesterase